MELNDIIIDSLAYPTKNIKALLVYIFLSVIMGIVIVATGITSIFTGSLSFDAGIIVGIIGIVVMIVLTFLIDGYSLDILKLAINHDDNAPEIDFTRQISNGVKYFIVTIVYMLIPIIITIALSLIFARWIAVLLGVILAIIFSFALIMAECRLAESEDLAYALNVNGAITDIISIGPIKVILTVIVLFIIAFIITLLVSLIVGVLGSDILTSIVSFIVDVYIIFFVNRVIGILYSDR